jgi:hypothetical protein
MFIFYGLKFRPFRTTLLHTDRTAIKKGTAARQKAQVRNPSGYFAQSSWPLILINPGDGL